VLLLLIRMSRLVALRLRLVLLLPTALGLLGQGAGGCWVLAWAGLLSILLVGAWPQVDPVVAGHQLGQLQGSHLLPAAQGVQAPIAQDGDAVAAGQELALVGDQQACAAGLRATGGGVAGSGAGGQPAGAAGGKLTAPASAVRAGQ
jgi:hypothetical protein